MGFARRKLASARGMLRPSFIGRMSDGIRQYRQASWTAMVQVQPAETWSQCVKL
jgi:hypothetical protein